MNSKIKQYKNGKMENGMTLEELKKNKISNVETSYSVKNNVDDSEDLFEIIMKFPDFTGDKKYCCGDITKSKIEYLYKCGLKIDVFIKPIIQEFIYDYCNLNVDNNMYVNIYEYINEDTYSECVEKVSKFTDDFYKSRLLKNIKYIMNICL